MVILPQNLPAGRQGHEDFVRMPIHYQFNELGWSLKVNKKRIF
jgi:hypothetical protein